MTGTIKVSPEKLIATAGEFSKEGSNMTNLVSEMINLVTTMNSSWVGDASVAYINKFNSLESDLQVLNRMIQEHVTDLQEMAKLYSTAEQQNAEDASSLASGIIS